HLVVCINKMDLVEFKQEAYEKIKNEFSSFSHRLDVKDVEFIPMSALLGDNVVTKSENMPWYGGTTLMYYLENVHIGSDHNFIDCRLPVQYVVRPYNDEYHDYRGYAGRIAGGVFKPGDKVTILPSGFTSVIDKIDTYDGPLQEAHPPMSVTMLLKDDIDISRGDMIVRENNQPNATQDLEVMLCWFNERPLQPRGKYALRHTSKEVRCIVKDVRYRLDINSLHRDEENKEINMNDICRVQLRTTAPVFVDSYRRNRITGSLILVDEQTNETVAAGMVI
ncbi:MAG: sulfate adenylyltransferase, partial [Bacteroidota bacterium]